MKARLILINWELSFTGLAIDSPNLAIALGFLWFFGSSILLISMQNRDWFNEDIKNSRFLTSLFDEQ